MSTFHWFLPTAGDSRDVVGVGDDAHRRAPTIDYLASVARTAEALGFEGVLTPTGTWCEDAWVVTAALLRRDHATEVPGRVPSRVRVADAGRPDGGDLPDGISEADCSLNVVTGGDATEQRRFGDCLDHDERYDRTDEFLEVLRGAWTGRAVRLRRSLLTTWTAPPCGPARPRAAGLLRRSIAGGGAGGGPSRRRVPRLGRAARHGRRAHRSHARAWPLPRVGRCASASACT